MPSTRNRNAWMWVAIAAVAFTSVAHAETRRQVPRRYAHPVFEFLARSQSQNSARIRRVSRFAHPRFPASGQLHVPRQQAPAHLIAMLPVLFIGLVSPLTLFPSRPSDPWAVPRQCLCFPRSSSVLPRLPRLIFQRWRSDLVRLLHSIAANSRHLYWKIGDSRVFR